VTLQNSKDTEDKALSLAEDQMPLYAAFMTFELICVRDSWFDRAC